VIDLYTWATPNGHKAQNSRNRNDFTLEHQHLESINSGE